MWCLKRFGLATAVLMAALPLGSLAQASVVVSNGGSMGLKVYATVAPDHPDYFVNEYHETIFDDDHASFSGTPTTLSVSASARLSYLFLASASIAVDARSEWTSPDHGTVDINSIGSRYQAPAGFEAGYGQLDGGPWGYSFTPNVDAVLTLSASGNDLYNGRYYVDNDVKFYVNNISRTYSLSHGDVSASFNLNAGTVYGISVFPWFTDEAAFTPKKAIDYTRISTRHFTFDIVAAPTTLPPTPIDSGVPEPGAWALLIAGFGIVGAAVRRRRAVIAASAAARE